MTPHLFSDSNFPLTFFNIVACLKIDRMLRHTGRCTAPIGGACTSLTNCFNKHIGPDFRENLCHTSYTVDMTQRLSTAEQDNLAHFAIHMYCMHIQDPGKLASDKPANEDI